MEKCDFSKYFQMDNIKYYNSKILINILEDILGKDINTINAELNNLKIVVTTEQIVEYLNVKFAEEEPEVKSRLENSKPLKNNVNLCELTNEEIEKSAQRIVDELTSTKYQYDSYTLDYFYKYSNIVRNKSKKILSII